MALPGEQAANLLQMTPFAWRASPEVQQGLLDMATFACETDFAIRLYRRIAPHPNPLPQGEGADSPCLFGGKEIT
jgi:23S rRNA (guanine745-N1)-methyltransferase